MLYYFTSYFWCFTSLICRYEHQSGGWKQLLALPVTRGKVFVAKYILIMLLVLAMQILYLGSVFAVGMVKAIQILFLWRLFGKA